MTQIGPYSPGPSPTRCPLGLFVLPLVVMIAGCAPLPQRDLSAKPVESLLPTSTPTADRPTSSALAAAREALLPQIVDVDTFQQTLVQGMSVPSDGGETAIFRWDEGRQGGMAGCAGYVRLISQADGSFAVTASSALCGHYSTSAVTPVTIEVVDTMGDMSRLIACGRVLDDAVGEVRVATDYLRGSPEYTAQMSNGVFYVELPEQPRLLIVRVSGANGDFMAVWDATGALP